MAVSMIGPKFYAWDKNGKPLAFGKLYTYQSRTNVPKATYQSEDQVVENTNPVILNGEGYANIYLSGSYKMVLKDSDENEIWTADPVSESNPTEWIKCLPAIYVSSTTFKVAGNFTGEYSYGRRVRIDNNSSNYSYATIINSIYADSNTTITLDPPVVTTGVVGSCVSIVGVESSPVAPVLQQIAIANNTTIDDVAYLVVGATYTGQHYFYDALEEKTYFINSGITGALTTISSDVNGVVTADSYKLISTSMLELGVIDTAKYGMHPDNTSAVNTTILNSLNALAVANNVPVKFTAIGVHKILRLDAVVGDLTWVADSEEAIIQVDYDNWPYASSSEPIIDVTGSFKAKGLTIDQNWLLEKGNAGAYRDDKNPTTWGGYWFAEVHGSSTNSDEIDIKDATLTNIYRGVLGTNIDRSVGGLSVSMTGCKGNSRNAVSQTILACEDPVLFHIADNPEIKCLQWNEGASYVSNGLTVFHPWGGENVRILSNGFEGYQLVCRGPKTTAWTAATSYSVGDEYVNSAGNAYVVTAAYISGATFGEVESVGVNVESLWNPQKKITLDSTIIQSPIADTALYGWRDVTVTSNEIYDSGDMGFALSGSGNLVLASNRVSRVRNGAYDVTGFDTGNVINVTGNISIDHARASEGVFSRIDTLNPGIYASNAGYGLAAITIGLLQGLGTRQVNISANSAYLETLPPLTDPAGAVRSNVLGIYSQDSANEAAFNTINFGNNFVQDLEADCPNFFISIPTAKFYAQTVTGTPETGEVFSAFNGGVKFILCAAFGSGSRVFIRKLVGAKSIPAGVTFTGSRSGATIIVAAAPQWSLVGSEESVNTDYTSKYINNSENLPVLGVTTNDPASVASGSQTSITITVDGAQVGDFALVAPPYQIAGLQMTAYVSNSNEVTVVLKNDTGAAIDLASGEWKARLFKG